jgi:hypothetical protein
VVDALSEGLPARFVHPAGIYGPSPSPTPGINDFVKRIATNQSAASRQPRVARRACPHISPPRYPGRPSSPRGSPTAHPYSPLGSSTSYSRTRFPTQVTRAQTWGGSRPRCETDSSRPSTTSAQPERAARHPIPHEES